MARDKTSPEFVEALARGLDVIKAFGTHRRAMSLTEVAAGTGLARATARRCLLTLEQLGYAEATPAGFLLTPRVLELGVAYTLSAQLWEAAQTHLEELVAATGQAASLAKLDGSDVMYVARVEIPKVVGVNINVGTRFPARNTALGKVLLAALSSEELEAALAIPSLAQVPPHQEQSDDALLAQLREIRSKGWVATDNEMTAGVRSIAAPIHGGEGAVVAAINLSTIASEVTHEQLLADDLPLLLVAAGKIGNEFHLLHEAPQSATRR